MFFFVPLQSQIRNEAQTTMVYIAQAHNLEVARSSPASATITSEVVDSQHFGRFPVLIPDNFQTIVFRLHWLPRRTM